MELYSFALLTLISLIFLALSTFFKGNWAPGFRIIASGLLVIISIVGLYGIEYENGYSQALNYTLQAQNETTYTLNTSDNTTYYVSGITTSYFINGSSTANTILLTPIANDYSQYFFIVTLLGAILFAIHGAWKALARKDVD